MNRINFLKALGISIAAPKNLIKAFAKDESSEWQKVVIFGEIKVLGCDIDLNFFDSVMHVGYVPGKFKWVDEKWKPCYNNLYLYHCV